MGAAEALRRILSEKTCVVGIGNPYRNDDGAGVAVAEALLRSPLRDGLEVVNAEDVLENHVFPLAAGAARNILLVDAVRCGGAPVGSLIFGRLREMEELAGGLSTHKLSLATSGALLESRGKAVYLLGIAAGSTDFGRGLSEEVAKSADTIVELIREGAEHGIREH
ncbi:MAG: hydrogenase maturation protease [Oligoflexia bacterium]|nr:hydrogenase maturation protease [Oligoflexia bacterium]